MNHFVQNAAPYMFEPLGPAEPFYDGGADGVVSTDKAPAEDALPEGIVPEPPQGPDLGTVVGAVHAGGDIAAVRNMGAVIRVVIGALGKPFYFPFRDVPIVIIANQTVSDFRGMACNISSGVVIYIAAEHAGAAVAGIVAVIIVVVDCTAGAFSARCHFFTSQVCMYCLI